VVRRRGAEGKAEEGAGMALGARTAPSGRPQAGRCCMLECLVCRWAPKEQSFPQPRHRIAWHWQGNKMILYPPISPAFTGR